MNDGTTEHAIAMQHVLYSLLFSFGFDLASIAASIAASIQSFSFQIKLASETARLHTNTNNTMQLVTTQLQTPLKTRDDISMAHKHGTKAKVVA